MYLMPPLKEQRIGEKETRAREDLKMIKALAPRAVIIEEEMTSSADDSGVSARLMSMILSELQLFMVPVFYMGCLEDVPPGARRCFDGFLGSKKGEEA